MSTEYSVIVSDNICSLPRFSSCVHSRPQQVPEAVLYSILVSKSDTPAHPSARYHTRTHALTHVCRDVQKKKKNVNKNKHTRKAKWSFHCVSKVSVSPFCNHVKCPVGLIRFDRPFCNHISPKVWRKAKGKGKETMCEGGSAGRWGSVQTKQNRTKYFSKCYNTDGEQVIPSRGTILSLSRSRFGSHSGLGSSNKCPKKCVWPPL